MELFLASSWSSLATYSSEVVSTVDDMVFEVVTGSTDLSADDVISPQRLQEKTQKTHRRAQLRSPVDGRVGIHRIRLNEMIDECCGRWRVATFPL
jgi:hypothetical protein